MDEPLGHSTAHHLLQGFNDLGLSYLFCNLGTDHAPLIEEMALWRQQGKKFPQTILCPHENTAVHMAAGYALATGQGQGVLVHVDAGTANAAMGIHNISKARLPLMLMAGRAPYTSHGELPGTRDTFVNFVQEPYDQGSLVRQYVKWDYNLPSGVIAKEALRRAHSVMQSDPKGPVYLTFARETLTEHWRDEQMHAFAAETYGPTPALGTDPQAIEQVVDRLLAAQKPLIITSYSGRNPATVAILDALARLGGIRVIECNAVDLNIPHDSPCFGGFVPGAHVAQADVGLIVDVDVPWIPRDTPVLPQTWWAHIDVDIDKRSYPMWSFPRHLKMPGDSHRILSQILERLQQRLNPAFTQAAQTRVAEMAIENQQRQQRALELARDPGLIGQINPHHVCAAVARAIPTDAIVLNEAIRNAPVVAMQVPRTVPGSHVGLAGGGLGFSAGMALGIKLAKPERCVVAFSGDGSFYFGNPQSSLAVAKQYGLPVFTVILDNGGWAAVKEATLRVFPQGVAKQTQAYQAHLAPDMNFAM
ncbi:MAG: thiamine pyrophosphate-requiring protein, partial [Betaproteobacteria bacterium]|nr:thiamine pyrophosphate-requiring protein [Betaproteobacteria bacterium]